MKKFILDPKVRNKVFFIFISLPVLIVFVSCSTVDKVVVANQDVLVEKYIDKVDHINKSLPETIYAQLDVKIVAYNKTIKAKGDLYYSKKIDKWKITLKDPLLNFVLFHIWAENGLVSAYSPMQKTMIVKKLNNNSISFAKFEDNPIAVFMLATGRVPLISSFSVKESFQNVNDSQKLELVLENQFNIEKIYFDKFDLIKVEIADKFTDSSILINFYDLIRIEEYEYFNKIQAVSNSGDSKLFVNYKSVKVNIPISDMKLFEIKLPSETKIYQ